MTRATVYGLALAAAVVAAIFTWKIVVGAGVAVAAWRLVVRRARAAGNDDGGRVRFGAVPSVAMLYAAWNTRRIGRRSEPLPCRFGLHRWATETGVERWEREPQIVTYQRCSREGCRHEAWATVSVERAPLHRCEQGHEFHGISPDECPTCRRDRARERRRRTSR